MAAMTSEPTPQWKALRSLTGLSQREIERRCGWAEAHRGRLSVIERGIAPTVEERATLMRVLLDAITEKGEVA